VLGGPCGRRGKKEVNMKYADPIIEINTKADYETTYPSEVIIDTQMYQNNLKKKERALEKALDIRKFEIELYWKRAGYFWTFIALTFTSFFLILINDKIEAQLKNEVTLILSGLGLFLSFCWFFVNKGSKYWQENWEKHVDLLEDDIIGPLYKTTVQYKQTLLDWINPIKPYKYSVGKINQILSFSIVLIWVYFFCNRISTVFNIPEPFAYFNILMIILGFLFVFILLFFAAKSSSKNGDDFIMKRRKMAE
jgi:hypothetical protein